MPGCQLVEQLAEQERVASGRAVARRREARDRLGQALAYDRGRRLLGERGGSQHMRVRRGDDRVEELLVGVGLCRPGRRNEQDWDVLEALGQEHQPAQRGSVGPVQVVRHQHQRLLGREVRDEPEQPLQRAEKTFLGAGLALIGAKHGRRRLGPAREELRPLRDLPLKQLAYHTERERAVELRPRLRSARTPAASAMTPTERKSSVLPTPAWPSSTTSPPSPAAARATSARMPSSSRSRSSSSRVHVSASIIRPTRAAWRSRRGRVRTSTSAPAFVRVLPSAVRTMSDSEVERGELSDNCLVPGVAAQPGEHVCPVREARLDRCG